MHKTYFLAILTTMLILAAAATSLAAWQANIEISTPDPASDTGIASNRLIVGADQSATDGYDNALDTIALLNGPIQAYVSHPEYPSGQQKLWRDFRPDTLPQEWEIEVESKENNRINVNWTVNVPANLNFILMEKDSGREIDMTSSDSYSYSSDSTMPKKFLLRVSEDAANVSPTPASSSRGGGGGCGYIKNVGREKDSMSNHRQIIIDMTLLLIPLLFSFHHVRRYAPFRSPKRYKQG